ncbi:36048_t:CDS:2, partial [Gigaspora margarita]
IMLNEDITLNEMNPFICNEQSSSLPITLASPIQNSAVSIDSNITEIDNYIDTYCSLKNFSKIIYGTEYDSELRRCYRYRCEFQGQYRSKKKMIAKEQRNTRSKRNGCPWFINASCPKTTNVISITTIFLEHENHSLDPLTNKFGTIHRILTEPMLADIEFWTTKGNLSMRTQRQLLEAKYANVFFLPQDLSNAIQKVKKEQQVDDEAAILINYLLEHQYELYVQYNDIVQYDNTYSTNRFKMVLGLLLIVDNNNQSRIVGQTLINDETCESFEWVFHSLVQATNIFPLVIITDNDLAIDAAIES